MKINWQLTKTILQLVAMVSIAGIIIFGTFIKTDKQIQYVLECVKVGGSAITDYPYNGFFERNRRCVKTESLVDILN